MEHLLIGLASIIVLGVLAQWIAWRLKLPSILLLLIFGFTVGAGTGLLNPEEIFGHSLFPAVSIAVAIILFEGGLNLHWSEAKEVGRTVRNLVTTGALVTWILTSLAAYFILDFDLALSVLLGAILVVTGPTVIMPILRHIRPSGKAGPILKWEGILIDPIGAFLAVLVFEIIFVGRQGFDMLAVLEIFKTLSIGSIAGVLGAAFIVVVMKRYWVPDFLHNAFTLMTVVGAFTVSDAMQAESGLFAVIVMGAVLANQKFVSVKHIVEFKENLQVLLIGGLFIVLAAQLKMEELLYLDWAAAAFIALLILLIRPLSVYASTLSIDIDKKTKIFLSSMAPRGIVAAAVASIFALRLQEINYPGAEKIVPITFFTIIGTVAIYGLGALPLAKRLKIADTNPQGMLIVGAHPWARDIGGALQEEGYNVLFIDSNWNNISAARMRGFTALYTNILSEHAIDEVDLGGVGHLLALTPNDQVNTISALRFASILGRAHVHQLGSQAQTGIRRNEISPDLRGRLFLNGISFKDIDEKFSTGAQIKTINISREFTYEMFLEQYGKKAIPLFISNNQKLSVLSENSSFRLQPGQKLISIVPENKNK